MGKILTSSRRAIGKHAQIMATGISIVDHKVTSKNSHVTLDVVAKEMSDWSRRVLMTVTLDNM